MRQTFHAAHAPLGALAIGVAGLRAVCARAALFAREDLDTRSECGLTARIPVAAAGRVLLQVVCFVASAVAASDPREPRYALAFAGAALAVVAHAELVAIAAPDALFAILPIVPRSAFVAVIALEPVEAAALLAQRLGPLRFRGFDRLSVGPEVWSRVADAVARARHPACQHKEGASGTAHRRAHTQRSDSVEWHSQKFETKSLRAPDSPPVTSSRVLSPLRSVHHPSRAFWPTARPTNGLRSGLLVTKEKPRSFGLANLSGARRLTPLDRKMFKTPLLSVMSKSTVPSESTSKNDGAGMMREFWKSGQSFSLPPGLAFSKPFPEIDEPPLNGLAPLSRREGTLSKRAGWLQTSFIPLLAILGLSWPPAPPQHSIPLSAHTVHGVFAGFACLGVVHFTGAFLTPVPHVNPPAILQHSTPLAVQVVHGVFPCLAFLGAAHVTAAPAFPALLHVFSLHVAWPLWAMQMPAFPSPVVQSLPMSPAAAQGCAVRRARLFVRLLKKTRWAWGFTMQPGWYSDESNSNSNL